MPITQAYGRIWETDTGLCRERHSPSNSDGMDWIDSLVSQFSLIKRLEVSRTTGDGIMGRIKERGAQGAPVSKFPCQGIKISHTNETVHESLMDRCNLPFQATTPARISQVIDSYNIFVLFLSESSCYDPPAAFFTPWSLSRR